MVPKHGRSSVSQLPPPRIAALESRTLLRLKSASLQRCNHESLPPLRTAAIPLSSSVRQTFLHSTTAIFKDSRLQGLPLSCLEMIYVEQLLCSTIALPFPNCRPAGQRVPLSNLPLCQSTIAALKTAALLLGGCRYQMELNTNGHTFNSCRSATLISCRSETLLHLRTTAAFEYCCCFQGLPLLPRNTAASKKYYHSLVLQRHPIYSSKPCFEENLTPEGCNSDWKCHSSMVSYRVDLSDILSLGICIFYDDQLKTLPLST